MNAQPLTLLSSLVLAFAACGGSGGKAADTMPSSSASTSTPTVFELGEITLFDHDQAVVRAHADGSTEVGYRSGTLRLEPGKTASSDSLPLSFKPGPTIAPSGTISLGDQVVVLREDGTFLARDGQEEVQVPDVTLIDDRVTWQTQSGPRTMELAEDGTVVLTGGNPHSTAALHVEGADTAGKRRLVLAIIALTFTSKKADTDVR